MVSPWPMRWPAFRRGSVPPIMMVGSSSAFIRTWVIMEVVVVFPWVPATHTAFL